MPMADEPFGSDFGVFADKFGIQWIADLNPKYN